jgi:hypothetical protein
MEWGMIMAIRRLHFRMDATHPVGASPLIGRVAGPVAVPSTPLVFRR